jgi:hypothetical protein
LGDLELVKPRRSLVLCYHAVSPTWEHRLAIKPDLLLRQVRALSRFRPVRTTFDDAFRSAPSVFPALELLGVPIQIFVCTSYARTGAPLTLPELAGDDPEQLATMDWDALLEHADRGVAIGSHAVSHAHLTTRRKRSRIGSAGHVRTSPTPTASTTSWSAPQPELQATGARMHSAVRDLIRMRRRG